MRIILVEGSATLLGPMLEQAQKKLNESLESMGV